MLGPRHRRSAGPATAAQDVAPRRRAAGAGGQPPPSGPAQRRPTRVASGRVGARVADPASPAAESGSGRPTRSAGPSAAEPVARRSSQPADEPSRPPVPATAGAVGAMTTAARRGLRRPGSAGQSSAWSASSVSRATEVDLARIERAVREILLAIGEDPDRDGLVATPAPGGQDVRGDLRRAREDPGEHLSVVFEADHDEMVMVKDIPVYSVCEHHLVPWFGRAHVAYIPNEDGRITGLSKLARLVDGFSRRPQVQERLTTQVADRIEAVLAPRGVLVVVEAEHLCMSMRGVRKPGTLTVTSAVRGLMRDSAAARSEAMSFIHGRAERRHARIPVLPRPVADGAAGRIRRLVP